jgi:hypothetical protein
MKEDLDVLTFFDEGGAANLPAGALEAKHLLIDFIDAKVRKSGVLILHACFGRAGFLVPVELRDDSEEGRNQLGTQLRLVAACFDLDFVGVASEIWATQIERSEEEKRAGPPPERKEAVMVHVEWPNGDLAHWTIEIKRNGQGRFMRLGTWSLLARNDRMIGRFTGFFPKATFSPADRAGGRALLEATNVKLYRLLTNLEAKTRPVVVAEPRGHRRPER